MKKSIILSLFFILSFLVVCNYSKTANAQFLQFYYDYNRGQNYWYSNPYRYYYYPQPQIEPCPRGNPYGYYQPQWYYNQRPYYYFRFYYNRRNK